MKATRLLTLLALLIAAMNPGLARDVQLSLNKHTFLNKDTLAATVNFIDFDDDPIVGEVYLDIISPEDSVVISAVMEPRADGTYSIAFQLPSNGFDSPEDITKVSSLLTINNSEIYSVPSVVRVGCDYGYYKYGGFEGVKKCPVNAWAYVGVEQSVQLSYNAANRDKQLFLCVLTRDFYAPEYYFTLQATGITTSGEVVAAIETISLPVIYITPYFPQGLDPAGNFLQIVLNPERTSGNMQQEMSSFRSSNWPGNTFGTPKQFFEYGIK